MRQCIKRLTPIAQQGFNIFLTPQGAVGEEGEQGEDGIPGVTGMPGIVGETVTGKLLRIWTLLVAVAMHLR